MHLLILALVLTSYYLGRLSGPRSTYPSPRGATTRFTVPPSLFVPPPPYPDSPLSTSSSSHRPHRVPKIVHYVYSLKPTASQTQKGIKLDSEGFFEPGQGEEGEEFPYYAYLAVRSVLVNVKPEVIYL